MNLYPSPSHGNPALPTPGPVFDYLDMAHREWDLWENTTDWTTAQIAAKDARRWQNIAQAIGNGATHSYSELD